MNNAFEQFVSQTVETLKPEQIYLGLAISGSWVRDEMDEFSDLDLIIVCEDNSVPDLPGMRSFAESLGPLVSSFSGEHVGEPTLLICLFDIDPLVHVDLKFSTAAELEKRPYDSVVVWERDSAITEVFSRSAVTPVSPDTQWIEDRFWTWIHYAALRIGRAELFDLVGFLNFLREQVLGPMALHAAGFPPFGVRKIDRYLPEFARRLEKTVPTFDLESCFEATLATIELYRELRSNLPNPVTVNERAETASVSYLQDVASKHHNLTQR